MEKRSLLDRAKNQIHLEKMEQQMEQARKRNAANNFYSELAKRLESDEVLFNAIDRGTIIEVKVGMRRPDHNGRTFDPSFFTIEVVHDGFRNATLNYTKDKLRNLDEIISDLESWVVRRIQNGQTEMVEP